MAKRYDTTNHEFVFYCDTCGKIASSHPDERIALASARAQRWPWHHPHWGLTCPDCQRKGEQTKEQNGGK